MAKNRTLISRYMHFFMMGKIAVILAVVTVGRFGVLFRQGPASSVTNTFTASYGCPISVFLTFSAK